MDLLLWSPATKNLHLMTTVSSFFYIRVRFSHIICHCTNHTLFSKKTFQTEPGKKHGNRAPLRAKSLADPHKVCYKSKESLYRVINIIVCQILIKKITRPVDIQAF